VFEGFDCLPVRMTRIAMLGDPRLDGLLSLFEAGAQLWGDPRLDGLLSLFEAGAQRLRGLAGAHSAVCHSVLHVAAQLLHRRLEHMVRGMRQVRLLCLRETGLEEDRRLVAEERARMVALHLPRVRCRHALELEAPGFGRGGLDGIERPLVQGLRRRSAAQFDAPHYINVI